MGERTSIAFINNFGGRMLGGGEVQLLALLRGLSQRDAYDMTLVCEDGSALSEHAEAIHGVRIVPVTFAGSELPGLPRRIAKQVGATDIVQGTGYLTNLIARRVGRRTGARVINVVHVIPGAERLEGSSATASTVRRLVDQATRGPVSRFIAVSAAVAQELERRGVEAARITLIPNGVDFDALTSADAESDSPRRGSGPHVTFVGRLEPVKGCEYFVRMAAILRSAHPRVRFRIVGGGSLEGELRVLALALEVADRVDFMGYVESPASVIATSDVVVVPSLSESFGLTAAEALALGVPVVATDVGGLPEVVVDGETGLVVPAADAEALAAAVGRLLDDPELAKRLAEAGQQRVREQFTVEKMVDGYVRAYGDARS